MIKKLKRDLCITKYRELPLTHYDKETDSEIFFYPEFEYIYWIKLEDDSKIFIKEFVKFIKLLEIENLIFLDKINKPWITKYTEKRKDYKPLIKALEYFKSQKIWGNFNGGVMMNKNDLKNFLPHFYMITRCDGGFFDYNFIDEKQNIIFYIYYTGEIKITTLNKETDEKFLKQIKKSKFVDSFRENGKRF